MEHKSQMTNQDYRKMIVKNAFELMKSNQREYSKQSNLYVPKSSQMNNKKVKSK